jgi:hypothetical protein
MYISRKKSLEIPLDFVTYQGQEEVVALIDSGAMNNFSDFNTVNKLKLGKQKIHRAIQIFSLDGTHN